MKNNNFKKTRGFTLIEMLLAISILVVLSGAILVSISSQRDKARVTRMLSEMSATIQPIYMCLGSGETVSAPSSGGNICSGQSAYGSWPIVPSYFTGYNSTGSFTADTWTFSAQQSGSGTVVYCSAALNGCEIQ